MGAMHVVHANSDMPETPQGLGLWLKYLARMHIWPLVACGYGLRKLQQHLCRDASDMQLVQSAALKLLSPDKTRQDKILHLSQPARLIRRLSSA